MIRRFRSLAHWILLLLLVATSCAGASAQAPPRYSQMVVFGDSLSDYGNVAIATDTPRTQPPTQLVGTWVMQLAPKLGLPPLVISSRGGTNYARCWATSKDVVEEVDAYLAAHPKADPSALYAVWAGGNDILNVPDRATADKAVETLRSQILRLSDAGAVHFLWVNLPPIGKLPVAPLLGKPADLTAASQEFNLRFESAVQDLARNRPKLRLTTLDASAKMADMMANKTAYGLEDVSRIAIGRPNTDPDKYMFWDGMHPTTRSHQIFAEYALERLSATQNKP